MENDQNIQVPRIRKALDIALTTLGIALFIVLGVRALSLAGDMKVAAGLKNKNTSIKPTSTTLDSMVGMPGALLIASEATDDNKPTNLIDNQKPAKQPATKQSQAFINSKGGRKVK